MVATATDRLKKAFQESAAYALLFPTVNSKKSACFSCWQVAAPALKNLRSTAQREFSQCTFHGIFRNHGGGGKDTGVYVKVNTEIRNCLPAHLSQHTSLGDTNHHFIILLGQADGCVWYL